MNYKATLLNIHSDAKLLKTKKNISAIHLKSFFGYQIWSANQNYKTT